MCRVLEDYCVTLNHLLYLTGSLTSPGDGYGDVVSYAQTSSAGVGVIPGDIVHMKANGGIWIKTDADAVATSTAQLGISLGYDDVLLRGFAKIYPITGSTSNTFGSPIYLSEVGGSGSFHAPGAGVARIIGHQLGQASNIIYFNPDHTWVEIA